MKPLNVAIIGGSFNPIHIGHMQLAELVAKHPDIDAVMLVPSHKSVFGKDLESFEDRYIMCQIVADSLNMISRREHFNKSHGIYFSVLDIEKRQELDGYTISLAKAIKKAATRSVRGPIFAVITSNKDIIRVKKLCNIGGP